MDRDTSLGRLARGRRPLMASRREEVFTEVLNTRVAAAARALARQAALLARGQDPPADRTATAALLRPLLDDLLHAAAQADIHLGPGLGSVAAALGVSEATARRRHGGAVVDLPLLAVLDGVQQDQDVR